MSDKISEIWRKCKEFGLAHGGELFIVTIVVMVGLLAFGLGRFSKIEEGREPITIEEVQNSNFKYQNNTQTPNIIKEKPFVASKNGTRYYFVWCGGANQISEKNKLFFATREAAEAAGYAKASNCKGL